MPAETRKRVRREEEAVEQICGGALAGGALMRWKRLALSYVADYYRTSRERAFPVVQLHRSNTY